MSAARPRDLVFIIDGTLSSLVSERLSNAGLTYRLLSEGGARADQTVAYDAGVAGGAGFRRWWRAATGLGVNDSIRRGYAFLSSRAREGDRIFLFGYSRGAYAARSLAGLIDRVGLLRPEAALQRRVVRAFRHYEAGPSRAAAEFSARHCRPARVEMIGAWDTVKALGLPYPGLAFLAPMATEFHDHALGPHIGAGYHALALDEDRVAFSPLLWSRAPGWRGAIEQLWFPGAHPDVGGQVHLRPAARALSNLPLVWMLEKAESHGLRLPPDWRERFPTDPIAPMVGSRRGMPGTFLLRKPRRVGAAPGEDLHSSVAERMEATRYAPRALGLEDDGALVVGPPPNAPLPPSERG